MLVFALFCGSAALRDQVFCIISSIDKSLFPMQKITVIIPMWNEEDNITEITDQLYKLDSGLSIIVADAGSSDRTVELAQKKAVVIQAPRGRGAQMNAAAAMTSGDILWRLHADTRPHRDSIAAMQQALQDQRGGGGAFEYGLDSPGIYRRVTEFTSNRKNHILKLFYGDMGIFVRRTVFEQLGGYQDIPIMEDMDLCKRMKKVGGIVILPPCILTSTRRWLDEGILHNVARNWLLQTARTLSVSPEMLSRWYTFGNKK